MALPFIVAALLGKAAAGAATKAAAGKAAAAGAKAASAHHAHGGIAREVVAQVKDNVKEEAINTGSEKAKGWWSRRKTKDKQA